MLIAVGLILLVLLLIDDVIEKSQSSNTITSYISYMVDFNIVDEFIENHQTFIEIEILSEEFLQAYNLDKNKIILRVSEELKDSILINHQLPYIGLGIVLEVNENEIAYEYFSSFQQNPNYVICYEAFYPYIQINRLD